jgi:hypothetical protein
VPHSRHKNEKKERSKITKLTLQMAVILRKIAIRKKNDIIAKQKT